MVASNHEKERTHEVKYRTRLKQLREAKELERMDIVEKSIIMGKSLTYQTVMTWENKLVSRIDADTTYVLKQILGCTLDELVYEVDE